MGLLNLRLLPQSTQEKGLLSDLHVVAEEECNSELKKDEEISSPSKSFFFYPQAPDAEGGVTEDENIDIFFIHEETLVPFFEPPLVLRRRSQGSPAGRGGRVRSKPDHETRSCLSRRGDIHL